MEKIRSTIKAGWGKSAGILPLLLFCVAFEILPILLLAVGSVRSQDGRLTLGYYAESFQPRYLSSFQYSLGISVVTAVIGTLLGSLLAYVFYTSGDRLRSLLTSLSSVTANFAGVPLAFAFIATLGANGLATVFLRDVVGWDLYGQGLSVYSFYGLAAVYAYFQVPLMVILILPAFRGLRLEWKEAAFNLGASSLQYWWKVGIPVLLPAIGASFFLLAANALGAYATAFGLSMSRMNLVTVQIGFLISGDVSLDPGLANALAMLLILLMSFLMICYQLLSRRSERWLKQ